MMARKIFKFWYKYILIAHKYDKIIFKRVQAQNTLE